RRVVPYFQPRHDGGYVRRTHHSMAFAAEYKRCEQCQRLREKSDTHDRYLLGATRRHHQAARWENWIFIQLHDEPGKTHLQKRKWKTRVLSARNYPDAALRKTDFVYKLRTELRAVRPLGRVNAGRNAMQTQKNVGEITYAATIALHAAVESVAEDDVA